MTATHLYKATWIGGTDAHEVRSKMFELNIKLLQDCSGPALTAVTYIWWYESIRDIPVLPCAYLESHRWGEKEIHAEQNRHWRHRSSDLLLDFVACLKKALPYPNF